MSVRRAAAALAAQGVQNGDRVAGSMANHPELVVAFLEQVIACYPGTPVYLVLDSAPTHTAKVVRRWLLAHPHVHVLWLPKYTAHEVNPAERIWGLMKDDVAANRLAGESPD